MNIFRKITMLFVALGISGLLVGCGNSNLDTALASATATNRQLTTTNQSLASQLATAKAENTRLGTELAEAKRAAQAERDAKWRARNEVVGAQKVAKSATLTAHSLGLKQAKARR